jgi:hypothetical protein
VPATELTVMIFPERCCFLREQQSLFDANVVLIEDKASDTQLIQELIADGCHGVTRYQPTTDKVMRLHAQTALIENGFVRIPEEAPWLAEYLHELTVFPKGKHDDQADSTAQFLDWYKKPGKDQGYIDWLREAAEEAERLRNPDKDRERHQVLLKGPPFMSVQTWSGRHLKPACDGTLEVSADDAKSLIAQGWQKLKEWIADEIPKHAQNKPEPPKTNWARGCMQWDAEQEEQRLARIAAEEESEKTRLARVARFMGTKLCVSGPSI